MAHLREQGYPVPEVFRIDGADMTMERLHGPTLAENLLTGRVAPRGAAAIMLDLLERLHRLPAPDWLPGETRGLDMNGRTILHLDLHPENIIETPAGPAVIDWTNAAAGDPAVDRAVSWTIIAELDPATLPIDPAPSATPSPAPSHRRPSTLPSASATPTPASPRPNAQGPARWRPASPRRSRAGEAGRHVTLRACFVMERK
nr:hypothetical protein GCM10025732_27730 [Glycomyces mayteni]